MKVTLKLVGAFIHKAGFSQRELELAPGTTVADILDSIPLDRRWPMVISRNGHGVTPAEVVQEGDRIMVAPVFSGG